MTTSKIVLFAFCCLYFLVVQAQPESNRDRELCERQNRICLANEEGTGTADEITNIINHRCRQRNPRWRTISRCQLAKATCELTLLRCARLSCRNMAQVVWSDPTRPTLPPVTIGPSPIPTATAG